MKKIFCIATAIFMLIFMSATSSTAGAARRHTIEGVIIGTGIALLGTAIYNDIHRDTDNSNNYTRPRHNKRYASQKRHNRRFKSRRPIKRWEIQRIWVGPVYEKKWNPGHYNRKGQWISGGYQSFLIREGYYRKEKVRVRH